jgi:G3E family GTPase
MNNARTFARNLEFAEGTLLNHPDPIARQAGERLRARDFDVQIVTSKAATVKQSVLQDIQTITKRTPKVEGWF